MTACLENAEDLKGRSKHIAWNVVGVEISLTPMKSTHACDPAPPVHYSSLAEPPFNTSIGYVTEPNTHPQQYLCLRLCDNA
jgi:hypothetical protein